MVDELPLRDVALASEAMLLPPFDRESVDLAGAVPFVASGTTSGVPHFGHFVFLPATSSFTLKLFSHPGHLKSITAGFLESARNADTVNQM
ncbi:MAG: hypothetical protein EXR98_01475 [Gemmataceae bacterium]|nr:hypothetical protein [Gemmataceae bacterium]